jgi:hypothetical protein
LNPHVYRLARNPGRRASIIVSTNDGSFEDAVSISLDGTPMDDSLGKLNEDGVLDIRVAPAAGAPDEAVRHYWGLMTSSFSPPGYP